jgi:RimJ/RimL family protein N-acetyltransferase
MVIVENKRSQKHIEKFGFKRQGYFRDEVIICGKFRNAYYYELLNKEFNYNKLKKKLLKKNENHA